MRNTTLEVGQVVEEKYRVDHLVGTGGMAEVWAGTNERTGKRIALKVILQSLATTPAARTLFHSEGLAASRVNHPNVVTIFDVIEHQGLACIVMELLDGETLGRYIERNGCLSAQEATWLLLPAMRGVAAAHSQGVIHRDLKPQNIFLCVGPDGRVVTTKVLDFGISVIVEKVLAPSQGVVPGLPMGTPGYMSPEHLSGMPVDGRCDVYGFGGLLYESLTAQMPFPGEPETALFERILNEPPPPLSRLRPDLSPGLVRIIETALAKNPNQRFADLNAMVGALEAEVMPASSPRSLTPLAGMSVAALGESLAAHPDPAAPIPLKQEQSIQHQVPADTAVQAISKNEPPSQHQETRMLFGFPLEMETAAPSSNGGSVRSSDTEKTPPPSATIRDTVVLRPRFRDTVVLKSRPAFRKARSGSRWISTVLGWRGLVGTGTIAVLVVAVWIATHDSDVAHPARLAPTATQPAVPLVVPLPDLSPPTNSATSAKLPSSPNTFATAEHSKPSSRAQPGLSQPSRSRVASRENQTRRVARAAKDDLQPPPAQVSAKSTSLRAGSLSADDF